MPKFVLKRSHAIEVLNELQDQADYLDEDDLLVYERMTNEGLAAEICLSGLFDHLTDGLPETYTEEDLEVE